MPVVVLIVASGAAWESPVLTLLGEDPGVVVLKRCVDVEDLLAAAAAGQADVAVLGLDSPGLDAVAVDHLHRHRVRPVAVAPAALAVEAAGLRASRVGIARLVRDDDLTRLPAVVREAGSEEPDAAGPPPDDDADETATAPGPAAPGRVVAVWGPAGAPGRTTLATGLAAELARRGRRTVLVDADPYGGAVAQQLGVLDEVSGLLAAVRLATTGQLEERFATVLRGVGPHLAVVTGLPRPDRWVEVRPGAIEHVLAVGRAQADVLVDTGFSLEDDPGADLGGRPGRNQLTLAALAVADEVVVVGSADPVGLARLARGLVELRERVPLTPVRVVVNRMRPSLGWSEKDVVGMVAGFVRPLAVHFAPDDRASVDRALVAGRTLVESAPDAALTRAVAEVASALVPHAAAPSATRGRGGGVGLVRRRRAGRARPR